MNVILTISNVVAIICYLVSEVLIIKKILIESETFFLSNSIGSKILEVTLLTSAATSTLFIIIISVNLVRENNNKKFPSS